MQGVKILIAIIAILFFASTAFAISEPAGPNIPGELAAIDFGKMIGGPLTAVINAQVCKIFIFSKFIFN